MKASAVINGIKAVLSSPYFPVFTAAMFLLTYYTGIDMVNIYIYAAVLIAMILLLDDLSPVIVQMLFLAVIASKENSPMYGNSDYYTQTAHFVQIGVLIGLIFVAAAWRYIRQLRAGKVHGTPVLMSVIALAVVYLMNGLFSSEHELDDFIYGVILAASLLPMYALLAGNVKMSDENVKKICIGFFIFSLVLVIELSVAYIEADESLFEIATSVFRSKYLKFGWGMWNNMGMLLVICIAPVMYLSLVCDRRISPLFIIWAAALCFAVILSTSRQAYIGGIVAFVLSAAYMLLKSKNRRSNYVVFGVVAVAAITIIVVWVCRNYDSFVEILVHGMFDEDGDFSGGRIDLYLNAIDNFLNNPVFGVGFYADNMVGSYTTAMTWFPLFYHDTIFQFMGSCGIVGLGIYLFHRIITVAGFVQNRTTGTTFLAITMLVYLIMSLFDNHMFYILSAFIYPALIVCVTNPSEGSGKARGHKLPGISI